MMIDNRHPLYQFALASLSVPGKFQAREIDAEVLAAAAKSAPLRGEEPTARG